MDITEFIKARLDEDGHTAQMAADDGSASANWHVDAVYPHSGCAGVSGANGEVVVRDEGSTAQMEAEHIARHDPARVLREVAAKRRIADDYRRTVRACRDVTGPEIDSRGYAAMTGARDAFRAACTALAAAWSDHPDYRAEWKPF